MEEMKRARRTLERCAEANERGDETEEDERNYNHIERFHFTSMYSHFILYFSQIRHFRFFFFVEPKIYSNEFKCFSVLINIIIFRILFPTIEIYSRILTFATRRTCANYAQCFCKFAWESRRHSCRASIVNLNFCVEESHNHTSPTMQQTLILSVEQTE